MKRLHTLSIMAVLLLGGCDAGNVSEDISTTALDADVAALTADTDDATTRIVGGTTVTEGVYPWATALHQNYFKGNGYNQFCGATLIADQWLLTAAHCVVDGDGDVMRTRNLFASVGTTNLESNNISYIGASQIIVHPDYNEWPFNDIALIKLESVPGNESISIPRWLSTPEDGEKVTLTGWGRLQEKNYTDVTRLREVDMVVRSETMCHPWYEVSRYTDGKDALDYDALVCAGGTADNVRSGCFGDSGSGLFTTRQNGEKVLAGITSGGEDCGEGGIPGLYTKVAKYQSWIRSQMSPASIYRGGTEEVLVGVEVQADWVRMDENDQIITTMEHGEVGRYRMPSTKEVRLISYDGDVDLLVYDSWRMRPEDLVCTSDNSSRIDECELNSRGTYYTRILAWEDSRFRLDNE